MSVLIGPSASGKSTILKVLAICRYFSYLVEGSDLSKGKGLDSVSTALDDWDIKGFANRKTQINYENDDYFVSFKVFDFDLFGETIGALIPNLSPKSDRFKSLIDGFYSLIPKNKLDSALYWGGIPHNFLTGHVKKVMDNPFYFPTERGLQSIFSLGKSSIHNLSDSLFNQFALLDKVSKGFKEEVEIEPLGISYFFDNGQGFFKHKGVVHPFKQAASGFKSVTPIALAIKYYSTIVRRRRTFLVEEPEQNLFPETQKALIEYLSSTIKEFGHSMVLTTHSPYILTSLENLMYADRLGNTEEGKYNEEVNAIVDKKYWINQDDISVYYLGETAIDLMDRKESLINKEYIDSVSKIVNNVFDQLLDIELKTENNTEAE